MAAGNHRLLNCSIAANLLLLLLLPSIYRCGAGAVQSLLPVSPSAASVSSVMMGSCRSAAECTAAGGGVIGEDELAMMMDSETNNRLLESATGKRLSYTTLQPPPACKPAVQNSCFADQKYGKKKCGLYQRTCGGGS